MKIRENFEPAQLELLKGNDIAHIAPPGEMVYSLMTDLFEYLKNDDDLILIKIVYFITNLNLFTRLLMETVEWGDFGKP